MIDDQFKKYVSHLSWQSQWLLTVSAREETLSCSQHSVVENTVWSLYRCAIDPIFHLPVKWQANNNNGNKVHGFLFSPRSVPQKMFVCPKHIFSHLWNAWTPLVWSPKGRANNLKGVWAEFVFLQTSWWSSKLPHHNLARMRAGSSGNLTCKIQLKLSCIVQLNMLSSLISHLFT